jgi:hypothetical protein
MGTGVFLGSIIVVILALGLGFGARALASQAADAESGCWELRDGNVGIYLWCAGDSDPGGWCANLADGGDMTPAAMACAVPALVIQKIPDAGMVAIAFGIGVLAFLVSAALSGRQRKQTY